MVPSTTNIGSCGPKPVTPRIKILPLSKAELGDPTNCTPATFPANAVLTSVDFAIVRFSPFTSCTA